MRTSESILSLAAALVAAQAKFPAIAREQTSKIKGETASGRVYEYSYSYADLASILEATRPALAEAGLCVIQPLNVSDGRVIVTTRVMHSSGEWIEDDYDAGHHDKPQPQGSAITYARRYSYQAMLGLAPERDDDGADAEHSERTPREQLPPCPKCGSVDSVIKSKLEAGGFNCWKKARVPGCGHSWGGKAEERFEKAVEESLQAATSPSPTDHKQRDLHAERLQLHAALHEKCDGKAVLMRDMLRDLTRAHEPNAQGKLFGGFESVEKMTAEWQFDRAWARLKAQAQAEQIAVDVDEMFPREPGQEG